jgi:hypothetical protein
LTLTSISHPRSVKEKIRKQKCLTQANGKESFDEFVALTKDITTGLFITTGSLFKALTMTNILWEKKQITLEESYDWQRRGQPFSLRQGGGAQSVFLEKAFCG